MAWVMPVLSIASTAMSVIGGIAQSKAQAKASNYNAQVAENNAAVAKQNATFAGQKGAQRSEVQNLKTRAAVGEMLAQQGASGVDVNSGSSISVRSSEAALGQLDAMNIRSNAAREAYGYQTQEMNYQAQSNLDRAQAKNAKKSGIINAITTGVGGIASGYSDGAFDPWLDRQSDGGL